MKKSKILIALSLVACILISAGAGAGTYAYFSKDLGTATNTINVAEFNPSMNFADKSFTLNHFSPDKDVSYMMKLKRNDTRLDLVYETSLTFTYDPNNANGNKKLFTHPNMIYYFSLNQEPDKYVTISKANGHQKRYWDNGQVVNIGTPPTKNSNESQTAFEYRLVSWYNEKGYPYLPDAYDMGTEALSFRCLVASDFITANPNDPDNDPTIRYTIKWPYESATAVDNQYINSQNDKVILSATAQQALNQFGSPDGSKTYTTIDSNNKLVLLNYNLHWGENQPQNERDRAWIRIEGEDRKAITPDMMVAFDKAKASVTVAYDGNNEATFTVSQNELLDILEYIWNKN